MPQSKPELIKLGHYRGMASASMIRITPISMSNLTTRMVLTVLSATSSGSIWTRSRCLARGR
jgi:hypothetical protein